MTVEHLHSTGTGPGPAAVLAATAALSAAVGYLLAAARLRRRGDVWPRRRDACVVAGGVALAAVALVTPPGGPFTAHMVRHLVVGMVAPLLLVLARPLTLVLRVPLPRPARRALLRVAHSRPAGWLVCPPLAALLDVGGLWLLYRTPLWAAVHERPLLDAAVHVHVFAAGLLFSFAVCRLDPVRRRWGLFSRGTALLGAGAAHAVLAKSFWAAPPLGTDVATADLRTGALLMYYGGDLVEIALAVVLAVQWYAAGGRALARGRRPRPSSPVRRSARVTGGYAQGTTRGGVAQRPAEAGRRRRRRPACPSPHPSAAGSSRPDRPPREP